MTTTADISYYEAEKLEEALFCAIKKSFTKLKESEAQK